MASDNRIARSPSRVATAGPSAGMPAARAAGSSPETFAGPLAGTSDKPPAETPAATSAAAPAAGPAVAPAETPARRTRRAIDWPSVRAAYEGDELTVAEICRRFGLATSTLAERRIAEGWPARSRRRNAGPEGGRAARRGRGLALADLTRHPVDAAAVRRAYEGSDASVPEITARFDITRRELTRLRIAGGWTARRPIAAKPSGTDEPPAKAVRRHRPARTVARRLLKAIETQLCALEAKMSDDTRHPEPGGCAVGGRTRPQPRPPRPTDRRPRTWTCPSPPRRPIRIRRQPATGPAAPPNSRPPTLNGAGSAYARAWHALLAAPDPLARIDRAGPGGDRMP